MGNVSMDVCNSRQAMSELKWTCTSCKSSLYETQCSIFLLRVPFTQTVLFLNSWSLFSWPFTSVRSKKCQLTTMTIIQRKLLSAPPPTTAPLQITYRHYIDGCMHLPDLSNGECRTSNKCDHSELFWLEIQRNGNSWFSIFSGKHWQHYLDDCYVSTNWVLVDCSVGLFFFFSRKMEEKIVQSTGWGYEARMK